MSTACSSNDADSPGMASGGSAGHAGSATAQGGNAAGSSAQGATNGGLAGRAGGGSSGMPGNGGAAAGDGGTAAGDGGTAPADGGAAGSLAEAGANGEAGASGQTGAGGDSGNDSPEVAYVSTYLGGIFVLHVDARSGKPEALEPSPVSVGTHLYAVVVEPEQRFLYAADLDAHQVLSYAIGDDGSLPAQASASLELDGNPSSMNVDPLGRFVYAATGEDKSIHVLSIDADSGALSEVAEPLVLDVAAAYVAADPSGQFVYTSQQFPPGIHGYRVAAETGELSELDDSPFAGELGQPGALAFRPDGAFLFSSGAGLNAFAIDPESGALNPIEGSPFSTDIASDAQATNIAVDPSGRFVYTTSFLNTNHVSGYRIHPTTGALEPVPGSPVHASAPYSVGVDPNGRFVFAGQDDGKLAVFEILAEGELRAHEQSPFDFGGLQPELAFASIRAAP